MKLIGLVRLGRDAEIRSTSSGDSVCSFSGAFNFGKKSDGNSQWVEFTLWGKRADSLAEYLLKGTQVFVVASEPHIQTYEKRDGGSGVKLVAKVDDIQFAGGKSDGAQSEKPQRQAAPQSKPAAKTNTGFDSMEDDIPW